MMGTKGWALYQKWLSLRRQDILEALTTLSPDKAELPRYQGQATLLKILLADESLVSTVSESLGR